MRLHVSGPLVFILLLSSASTLAAPKADLWDRWVAHDPQSTKNGPKAGTRRPFFVDMGSGIITIVAAKI